MKALHVIPSLSLRHGGPSFVMPLIERALAMANVEVTVATTDDDGPLRHAAVPLEQRVRRDFSNRYYFRKQCEFYKCSLPLLRWLTKHVRDYDLVHIHALFSFASVAAAWCARRQRVPYIIRPLGVLDRYGRTRRRALLKALSLRCIERPLLRDAAAVHYTSERERSEAREVVATARGVVVPLGIDLAPFQNMPGPQRFRHDWPETAGREVVLFLSRIDPKKGVDLLLDAFARVRERRPGSLLVIAGNGEDSYIEAMRARAARLGIARDVLWCGFLDGADKLSALAAASVFVLPSQSENFGLAAVEALAAGIPVVLSEEVGIARGVDSAAAGRVTRRTARHVAEAVEWVLADPERGMHLAMRGRQLAEDRYSLPAMGQALRCLYDEVLRGNGCRA